MKNPLNIPKLAKNMSIEDKIRLLFADSNKQAETYGDERLLSPDDRESIINEARKNNEIQTLRDTSKIYRYGQFVFIQMETDYLRFQYILSYLERFIIGCMVKLEAEDIVSEILYDFSKLNKSSSDNDLEKLQEKYWDKNKLLDSFSYFTEVETVNGQVERSLGRPNEILQKSFMATFNFGRVLKIGFFEFQYLRNKVSLNIFAKKQLENMEKYKKEIGEFVNLNGLLQSLRIFRDYDLKWFDKDTDSESKFFNTIKNLPQAIELTDKEKTIIQNRVDNSLGEEL